MMIDCQEFLDWEATQDSNFVNDLMEEITEAGISGEGQYSNRVRIDDVYQQDACNHVYSGVAVINGIEYGFQFESGNNNGSVVLEWGDCASFEPPASPKYKLVSAIQDPTNKQKQVQRYWIRRNGKEFLRKYAYDVHFAPGEGTQGHYQKTFDKRVLAIEQV